MGNIVSDRHGVLMARPALDFTMVGGKQHITRTVKLKQYSSAARYFTFFAARTRTWKSASLMDGPLRANAITTSKNLYVCLSNPGLFCTTITVKGFITSVLYRLWPTSCPIVNISCAAGFYATVEVDPCAFSRGDHHLLKKIRPEMSNEPSHLGISTPTPNLFLPNPTQPVLHDASEKNPFACLL